MTQMYVEKLQDHVLSYILMFSFFLLLIGIGFLISLLFKPSKKVKKVFGLLAIAVLLYASARILPRLPDLNEQSIVTKECSSYTLEMEHIGTRSMKWEMVVDVVGEDKNLFLTFIDDVQDFPSEGGAGTVVYTKHSRTFLDYLPSGSTMD